MREFFIQLINKFYTIPVLNSYLFYYDDFFFNASSDKSKLRALWINEWKEACLCSVGCRKLFSIIVPVKLYLYNCKCCKKVFQQYCLQVYLVFLAPVHALSMVKAGRPEGLDTTGLVEVITGGSAMSRKQFLEFRDMLPGTHLSQGYGQTEVAGVITKFSFSRAKDVILEYKNPESCGRPLAGIWYKVRTRQKPSDICKIM